MTKFSDKYTVDELTDKCFPWAAAIAAIGIAIWIAMCIADLWNIVLVPIAVCALILVGCVFLMIACGLSVGIAKTIYLLEGKDI